MKNRSLLNAQGDKTGLFSCLAGEDCFVFNEQALSVMGRNNLTMVEFADLFHPEEKSAFLAHVKQLYEHEQAFSCVMRMALYGETVLVHISMDIRDGFVFGSISHLADEGGEIKFADESMSDEELRMSYIIAQRNALAKSSYISDMAHEIRTPMNAILGFTSLMKNTGLSEKQADFNENIEKSAHALFRTVNNILDFSKIELGKMHLNKVGFLIEDVIMDINTVFNTKAAEKGLTYSHENTADDVGELMGDPLRLNQVLTNILHNAVQFTNSGGIKLKIEKKEENEGTVTILFSVQDTGVGMSPSQVSLLFDNVLDDGGPVTRKYGGNGLSLMICKNLVNLMDGDIWCESRVDEGSTFYFTAVFDKAGSIRRVSDLDSEEFDSLDERYDDSDIEQNATVRILVVEDIDINQTVIKEILRVKGYRAEFAQNGEEALAMLEEKPFDIVFMDIRMPIMDGLTATRHIRADGRFNELPIIAMTAHASPGDRERSIQSGMNSYISKPIEAELVYRSLRCWIKK